MEQDIRHIRSALKDMCRLMEELVDLQRGNRQCCRAVALQDTLSPTVATPEAPSVEMLEEHHLMTIKEAMAFIPVSRTKLYEMRKEGMLDTIERNSRQKRLLRTQVEAARTWSRNKGKW